MTWVNAVVQVSYKFSFVTPVTAIASIFGSSWGSTMTLTAQGCGMGASIAIDARQKLLSLPGVAEANVDLVWDPPWTPQMISPEGRERLGLD